MGLARTLSYIRQRRAGIPDEIERQHAYLRLEMDILTPHMERPLDGARALDIGCGQMLPMLIGLTAEGCKATGIDLDPYLPGKHLANFARRRREEGVARAASQGLRNVLVDEAVGRGLALKLGARVNIRALDVRVMDVGKLDFEDGTFDLMTSMAVFEHIADMPGALGEIHRTLKPRGVACLHAHLFPSYTGGHNRDMLNAAGQPIESSVVPWDHLRGNSHPAPAYLNKYRMADFRRFIEESPLALEAWHAHPPGEGDEARLTPEIEQELSAKGFTRDDLLTTSLHIVVRKP
jgi:SAM-dependent methyltransferase